jgi:hypothetical protein
MKTVDKGVVRPKCTIPSGGFRQTRAWPRRCDRGGPHVARMHSSRINSCSSADTRPTKEHRTHLSNRAVRLRVMHVCSCRLTPFVNGVDWAERQLLRAVHDRAGYLKVAEISLAAWPSLERGLLIPQLAFLGCSTCIWPDKPTRPGGR